MSALLADEMQCPACRARQAWSETCRRCRCDLQLLLAAAAAYRDRQEACLRAWREGNYALALQHARSCCELDRGGESQRLMAVGAAAVDDWPTAVALLARDIEAS